MVTLIGLDLAWTAHRPSGRCVLEADVAGNVELRSIESVCLTPVEFADWIAACVGDVVAAVDAPLLVSDPALGHPPRVAERQLNSVYGTFKAWAYSANLAFLTKMNGLAGPELGLALADRGFAMYPLFAAERPGPLRMAFEMYPHAAHIELFGLLERLPYKKGRIAARRQALGRYQAHLATLLTREMPRVLVAPKIVELLSPEVLLARGAALKAVEDQLDGLTCAIVACHAWRHGAPGMRVFGDENGYIAVPRLLTPGI